MQAPSTRTIIHLRPSLCIYIHIHIRIHIYIYTYNSLSSATQRVRSLCLFYLLCLSSRTGTTLLPPSSLPRAVGFLLLLLPLSCFQHSKCLIVRLFRRHARGWEIPGVRSLKMPRYPPRNKIKTFNKEKERRGTRERSALALSLSLSLPGSVVKAPERW